jgi:hypothetical protein
VLTSQGKPLPCEGNGTRGNVRKINETTRTQQDDVAPSFTDKEGLQVHFDQRAIPTQGAEPLKDFPGFVQPTSFFRRVLCKLDLCHYTSDNDGRSIWEKCDTCGSIREFRQLDPDEALELYSKAEAAQIVEARTRWARDEDDDFFMQVGP